MKKNIYLDYAATTPVDERVLQTMLPYFSMDFGNPSSIHGYGQKAENAIETAREVVAEVIQCEPSEVIFTSCGSESDNLAIKGAGFARKSKDGRNHILASKAEHHAVSLSVDQMKNLFDFNVTWLIPDDCGMIQSQTIVDSIRDTTAVCSVMLANNEIGTINPIGKIAEICRKNDVLLHTDAVQAAAYVPVHVDKLGVDLLSLGGHKFYGPKGVGALYIRKGTSVTPIQTGGGQEFGLRAGTQNVPYIVGFAEALRLTDLERESRTAHVKPIRDHIIGHILESIPHSMLTGHPSNRMPNHCSFVFEGVDGNLLLTMLDAEGFSCSSGSACKTGSPEPSEVIQLLGLSRDWGLGSLRVTLGQGTNVEDVELFLSQLPALVEKARKLQ
jgi:cysteine desulfurase